MLKERKTDFPLCFNNIQSSLGQMNRFREIFFELCACFHEVALLRLDAKCKPKHCKLVLKLFTILIPYLQ